MRQIFFFRAIPLLVLGNEQVVPQKLFISDVDAVCQARMDQNDAMVVGDLSFGLFSQSFTAPFGLLLKTSARP